MSESALAIAERKPNPQRSGGCVGIFFQLFDWNRRFSKKKFFPKKLLPPARAKVSKRFNTDDKLPMGKHLLIANENNGGFPSNKKKNGGQRVLKEPEKPEMQSPGLVARLMGLDAMPVDCKSNSGSPKSECKGGGGGGGLDGSVSSPEKNVRPQKIQKTGVSERRPVTRFGAEALQIKSVLSRARKHHHPHHPHPPKLASPVKSPKVGGRNGSRLMDAAARILEPGLQATNRARCSLTYSRAMSEPGCEEGVMNDVEMGTGVGDRSVSSVSGGRLVREEDKLCMDVPSQLPCRSCGSFSEKPPVGFDLPAAYLESRHRPVVYLENETDVVLLKTRYQPECGQARVEGSRPVESHGQIPASRMFTSQRSSPAPVALKDRAPRRGQMLVGDRVPPRSRLANMNGRRPPPSVTNVNSENKDFVALNRNMNRAQIRVPGRPDASTGAERRFCTGKTYPSATQRAPVRKRRSLNASQQADSDNASSTNQSFEKQGGNSGNFASGNGLRSRASCVNRTYVKSSRTAGQRGVKDTDVVSFAFSSPVKSGASACSHSEMGVQKRGKMGSVADQNSQERKAVEGDVMKRLSQNPLRVNGDAIGALLEQKLKELTHQAENEATAGFLPSAKTTASILQELISALTAERPMAVGPDENESQSGSDSLDGGSQAKSRIKRSSGGGLSHGIDRFSPGCVLDATFSNESCISSSIDDSSGNAQQSDYMDLSYDTVRPASTDADLSDSASSVTASKKNDVMAVMDLQKHIAAALQNVDVVHETLSGTKLEYAQEILVHAEFLFGNGALHKSPCFLDFLLGPFLDELEYLVIAAWKNSVILGLEVRKEENPVRRFLFNCILECLDVKYHRYSNCGYTAWRKLPKSMNADILFKVFDEEVRKWISLAGKAPDEIIEREMSTSLGKWTDFEIEVMETGAQISQDIVQTLVDEIVGDLCGSELGVC